MRDQDAMVRESDNAVPFAKITFLHFFRRHFAVGNRRVAMKVCLIELPVLRQKKTSHDRTPFCNSKTARASSILYSQKAGFSRHIRKNSHVKPFDKAVGSGIINTKAPTTTDGSKEVITSITNAGWLYSLKPSRVYFNQGVSFVAL